LTDILDSQVRVSCGWPTTQGLSDLPALTREQTLEMTNDFLRARSLSLSPPSLFIFSWLSPYQANCIVAGPKLKIVEDIVKNFLM
jgi:hypothetical protein